MILAESLMTINDDDDSELAERNMLGHSTVQVAARQYLTCFRDVSDSIRGCFANHSG